MGTGAARSASWQSLLGLGAVGAVLLLIGLGLGRLIDSSLGTSPAFLLVGLAVGLVAAVTFSVVKFRQYLKS